MLAVSIQNALAAQTPVPVVPAFDAGKALPASLFNDLFGAQLSAIDQAANPPIPTNPKESVREKDASAQGRNISQLASLPFDFPPIPLPVPAPAPAPPPAAEPASGAPAADSVQAPANLLPLAVAAAGPTHPAAASLSVSIPALTAAIQSPAAIADPSAVSSQDPQQPQPTTESASSRVISSSLSFQAQIQPLELDSPLRSADARIAAQTPDAWPIKSGPATPSPATASSVPDAAAPQRPSAAIPEPQPPSVANFKSLQGARPDLKFFEVQAGSNAQGPASPYERVSHSPVGEGLSKLVSTLPSGAAVSTSLSTKAIAATVPQPAFHDALQTQVANAAQSVTNGLAISKPPAKDSSTGSQSNQSNSSSDRSSNSTAGRTEASAFTQSLDTAGANAVNSHPQDTNSAVTAADLRVPIDPRLVNADSKPGSTSVPSPADAPTLPATQPADQPVVSGARLAEAANQTEIRIEMQAGPLGAVELRAHISGDQIGAVIAVEHHDAQLMLANDLPALHSALADKNLHVNTLNVSQGMATSTGTGHDGGSYQRAFAPFQPKFPGDDQAESVAVPSETPVESVDVRPGGIRLSVLA